MNITFDGVEITKYLRPTRGLDRGILPEIDYRSDRVGNSDGYVSRGASLGKRTIPMPFLITDELIKNRRALAKVLWTRTPKKLIFSDEPDKYWMAYPEGNINVDEIVMLGKGTINWVVNDGVAHDVNPRIFSNVVLDNTTGNQVLDSEFQNRNKYYKPWALLLQQTNGTSNIIRGDFRDTNTIADQGETKYNGYHIFQNSKSLARNYPSLAVGNKVSAGVMVRIDTPSGLGKTGVMVLQELDFAGGKVLANHEVFASDTVTGWQTLKLENIAITNPSTKALNLITAVAPLGQMSVSKPQFNLGATLAPYTTASMSLTDYVAVTNTGSYRTFPIIRALMKGENGLVGVANQEEGILQFGNADDIDTVTSARTDKVISIPMRNNASKFELNSPKARPDYPNFLMDPTRPNKVGGSIDWTKNPEAASPVYPTNTDAVWAGPTLYTDIPRNSANLANGTFLWRNRLDFLATKATSGRMNMVLQDADQSVLSIVVRDSSRSLEELIVEFSCYDKVQKRITLDRKLWTGKFWEASIERTGDMTVTYKFSQFKAFNGEGIDAARSEIFNATLPQLANQNIEGMCCWFMKWGDDPTNKYAALMDWTDTKFYWTNGVATTNIPNLFDDGDLLEIDTAARKVYINGIENFQIQAIDNMWSRFAIEPGTETYLPIASTWADMYECQVEVRGAHM